MDKEYLRAAANIVDAQALPIRQISHKPCFRSQKCGLRSLHTICLYFQKVISIKVNLLTYAILCLHICTQLSIGLLGQIVQGRQYGET